MREGERGIIKKHPPQLHALDGHRVISGGINGPVEIDCTWEDRSHIGPAYIEAIRVIRIIIMRYRRVILTVLQQENTAKQQEGNQYSASLFHGYCSEKV